MNILTHKQLYGNVTLTHEFLYSGTKQLDLYRLYYIGTGNLLGSL